ncbi:serine/threonine protein kinase [Rhodosporidiobolus nylandii]
MAKEREGVSTRTPQSLKDRRSTFPSSSSPSHFAPPQSLARPLPTLTSTSPSPISSPFSPPSRASSGPSSPALPLPLPPTDPSTPAQASFPSASTSLAQFIQHKRRQASAPYFASARELSLFSPGAGFSLGPSPTASPGGGAGGEGSPYAGGWGEAGRTQSRSRAASRRATGTGLNGGLSLQTSALMLGLPGDEGLVVTPTTEEWRQLGGEELVGLRSEERMRRKSAGVWAGTAKKEEKVVSPPPQVDEERDKEKKAGEGANAVKSPVKPRWKRWPSLHDDSDEYGESSSASSSDEDEQDFALSLSLSRLAGPGGKAHQLPHTPPPASSTTYPPAASAPPSITTFSPSVQSSAPSSDSGEASTSDSPTASRPPLAKQFKSSFSYSSSGAGANGGFKSHSNTNSLSSFSTSFAPSPAPEPSSPPRGARAPQKPPGSDPLPHAETFASPLTTLAGQGRSTHKLDREQRKSESHLTRPALSRGSLSATVGGLGTPSPPASVNGAGSVAMSPSPSSERTAVETTPRTGAEGEKEGGAQEKAEAEGGKGPGKIPLPPSVFRSLEQGTSAADGVPSSFAPTAPLGPGEVAEAIVTPLSVAGTPYDGDPFASTAPVSLPPTPAGPPASSSSASPSSAAPAPVDLDWTKPLGPVDPRTYSAVTGLRDLGSFVIEGEEAGKGAYGSVRRAREKGPDGKAKGPELIIKYVIKQRILADCWKKHKILGPIPIEVHVLDHLRRVPYSPRPAFNYLRNHSASSAASPVKRAQPVRRDSAPKLDLWKGGEDGGAVRTGHPNVCPLLDFFEGADNYMLVMPQATSSPVTSPSTSSSSQGQDLFDYVDAHPSGLPPSKIQDILRQLVDAIWFLHEHSIVHRDIKDENVVLDPHGTVKLIDFGSAAYVKEGRKFDTFSGTLDFAAPEVLKGARYGGKEQDIWALGVLGYVLVCGECPFWSPDEAMRGLSGDSRAYAALQSKLVGPSSPPAADAASSLANGTSSEAPSMADAIDLVQRCLEISQLDRPSADMIADHVFLAGEGGWRGKRGWETAGMAKDEGA